MSEWSEHTDDELSRAWVTALRSAREANAEVRRASERLGAALAALREVRGEINVRTEKWHELVDGLRVGRGHCDCEETFPQLNPNVLAHGPGCVNAAT